MVIGDFNSVLYTYERMGGEHVHWRETEPLAKCLTNSRLIDLKSKGCYYTWVRRGESGDRKCSKIDRVVFNMEWLSLVPDCTTNFLQPVVSDHYPILIEWDSAKRRVFPFRYNNRWSLLPSYKEFVTSTWNETLVLGDLLYCLLTKLKRLKGEIRR